MNQRYEYQRLPAVEKQIVSLHPANDQKVKVLGIVLSRDSESFMLDDGTGTIKAVARPEDLASVHDEDLVRISGRPLSTETGVVLQCDVIEKKDGFNTKLYRRVLSLWQQFVRQV